jgi:hypothetical protein
MNARTVLVSMMVALSVAAVAAPVAAEQYGCSTFSMLETRTGHNGGGTGPTCSMAVTCPVDHAGGCTLQVEASVDGTGLVGVEIVVDRARLASCDYVPSACGTSASSSLYAGDRVWVACEHHSSVAVNVTVRCTATVV